MRNEKESLEKMQKIYDEGMKVMEKRSTMFKSKNDQEIERFVEDCTFKPEVHSV